PSVCASPSLSFDVFTFYHYNLVSFFFNDTPTTEIYTLSLHDALPISWGGARSRTRAGFTSPPWPSCPRATSTSIRRSWATRCVRSEEHTSELQSRGHLVCRLLLEKKKSSTSRPLETTSVIASRTTRKA